MRVSERVRVGCGCVDARLVLLPEGDQSSRRSTQSQGLGPKRRSAHDMVGGLFSYLAFQAPRKHVIHHDTTGRPLPELRGDAFAVCIPCDTPGTLLKGLVRLTLATRVALPARFALCAVLRPSCLPFLLALSARALRTYPLHGKVVMYRGLRRLC